MCNIRWRDITYLCIWNENPDIEYYEDSSIKQRGGNAPDRIWSVSGIARGM